MAGYYNPTFGQDYLAARGIGPQMLNTNEKKGVAPSDSVSTPVKPIKSWSDVGDQISQPFTDQFNSISNTAGKISNTASQLGQGNMMGAVNAARGAAPAAAAPAADAVTDSIPGAVDYMKSVTPLSSDSIVSSIGDALSGGMDALAALFA